MNPKGTKISTGYLTPQAKKTKPTAKRTNLSDPEEENENPEINSQLVEALLRNPEKKKMILQLLSLNKDVIEKHGESSLPNSVDKLKKSKKTCESPTALMRRRALEKMNGSPTTSNNNLFSTNSNGSSSSSSTPLDKVLEGVTAYVEIRDRQNEDKSRGAKEILKSMGATVVDKLTHKVTHLIFKDGSYKTFQQAKLLKVHRVSILWVEFSRKTLQRANEKRFPAMGNEFEDETIVCSQMQKEYEDIIRDEYRKSILQGTPLPSTRALINRRRTLMTPSVTKNDSNSDSSYDTAISSQDKVTPIAELPEKEQLIINDPEGLSLNRASDMELTNIQNDIDATPKRSYNNNISMFDRRKTIGHSLCSEINKKAPQLRVSIEKLQLRSSSSSNDSEIRLPSTKNQHKSRKSCRKTLAFPQADSDSSCDSFQAGRRKTLASRTNPSQTLVITEELLTSDSSAGFLKQVKAKKLNRLKEIASKKHVISDSDNTDVDEPVTRAESETVKQIRAKKVAPKSRKPKEIVSKKHVTGDPSDSDNTVIDKSPIRVDLLTSDSSDNSLESALELQKKITSSSRKVASKTQKSAKKHVTGDSMKSRILYDPNTSIRLMDIDDEQERQEKREQNKKRRLEQAGFVNPVAVLFDKIAKNATESSDSQQSEVSPPKKSKKPANDNSDDEQKQLLDEVLKRPKTIQSRRKSLRIFNSAKKATVKEIEPTASSRRRSTMDFMSKTQTSSKKKIDKAKLPTIVCTKLHRSEVQVFSQIVKKLGRFVVEDEVSEKTTHVVAGEAKRTLNMLRAIARGCWVLKHEWVLRSLEAGKWLPEEPFELDDFSPAVRKCRLERQAFGAKYTMDVFESCPPIFVTLGTTPRCSDLRDLIGMCKGKVVTNPRMAMIIVGQNLGQEQHIYVTEKWVLDSVNFYEKMDFHDYLIEGGDKRKSFAV